MSIICKHLWVTGRVQGVFFRHSTKERAHHIGDLLGWVKNLEDGRVEVLAQGPEGKVNLLVEYCRSGPPMARVDDLEVREETPHSELAEVFEVQH